MVLIIQYGKLEYNTLLTLSLPSLQRMNLENLFLLKLHSFGGGGEKRQKEIDTKLIYL